MLTKSLYTHGKYILNPGKSTCTYNPPEQTHYVAIFVLIYSINFSESSILCWSLSHLICKLHFYVVHVYIGFKGLRIFQNETFNFPIVNFPFIWIAAVPAYYTVKKIFHSFRFISRFPWLTGVTRKEITELKLITG